MYIYKYIASSYIDTKDLDFEFKKIIAIFKNKNYFIILFTN
jgi:hypothetical protein